ncbi:MAG: methionine--tRNA ligase [Gammaproteobacteria bacterium AqS3]|nr:methionine--tRNA ligase [Gammaproteobacteria bacterium AqS3]
MPSAPRRIAITNALPYANGDIHLGHLLEVVQCDIWARFQRLRGHEVLYVCADDAHGSPVMLRAEREGISPEAFIDGMRTRHLSDFQAFGISYDNYHSTHSEENRELVERIYAAVGDHIRRREISQLYDTQRQAFLSDRYVKGACPRCGAAEQYGDHCEACGATYSAEELIDPVSILSDSRPEQRRSEHYFFDLPAFTEVLRQWVDERIVQEAVVHKLQEWFDAGLQQWDISRDAPYFGFTIPGETRKYFYVWLDAPIGYMASQLNHLKNRGREQEFEDIWKPDSDHEVYHFIGKDIANFHTLFWPALLHAADMRMPSGVFVHGFLTVNGEKMSKTKGTFILARTYAEHLDPEYLRYFFAARLGAGVEDIDLNLGDFAQLINSDLIGKLVNIASRCAGLLHRWGGGEISESLHDPELWARIQAEGAGIAECYEQRQYAAAVRRIMACTDATNEFIQRHAPWQLAREPGGGAEAASICSQGLNLYRLFILWLKPALPKLAERSERLLNIPPMQWCDGEAPLKSHRIRPFEPLLVRIAPEQIDTLLERSREDLLRTA